MLRLWNYRSIPEMESKNRLFKYALYAHLFIEILHSNYYNKSVWIDDVLSADVKSFILVHAETQIMQAGTG